MLCINNINCVTEIQGVWGEGLQQPAASYHHLCKYHLEIFVCNVKASVLLPVPIWWSIVIMLHCYAHFFTNNFVYRKKYTKKSESEFDEGLTVYTMEKKL